jgi:hypothetical protein
VGDVGDGFGLVWRVVPDGTSNATIAGSGTETVTVSSNQAVNLLTLGDANATLAVTANHFQEGRTEPPNGSRTTTIKSPAISSPPMLLKLEIALMLQSVRRFFARSFQ